MRWPGHREEGCWRKVRGMLREDDPVGVIAREEGTGRGGSPEPGSTRHRVHLHSAGVSRRTLPVDAVDARQVAEGGRDHVRLVGVEAVVTVDPDLELPAPPAGGVVVVECDSAVRVEAHAALGVRCDERGHVEPCRRRQGPVAGPTPLDGAGSDPTDSPERDLPVRRPRHEGPGRDRDDEVARLRVPHRGGTERRGLLSPTVVRVRDDGGREECSADEKPGCAIQIHEGTFSCLQ